MGGHYYACQQDGKQYLQQAGMLACWIPFMYACHRAGRLAFLLAGQHEGMSASGLAGWLAGLQASKHEILTTSKLSSWLEINCTVQFVLSTA
jgi:hypothetical protein